MNAAGPRPLAAGGSLTASSLAASGWMTAAASSSSHRCISSRLRRARSWAVVVRVSMPAVSSAASWRATPPSAGPCERAGPVTSALLAAARAGEPDLQEFAATIDRERLAGAAALAAHLAAAGALAPGLRMERARDLIWFHTAPDTYRQLVLERGWTLDEYERWFAASLAAALLPERPSS